MFASQALPSQELCVYSFYPATLDYTYLHFAMTAYAPKILGPQEAHEFFKVISVVDIYQPDLA